MTPKQRFESACRANGVDFEYTMTGRKVASVIVTAPEGMILDCSGTESCEFFRNEHDNKRFYDGAFRYFHFDLSDPVRMPVQVFYSWSQMSNIMHDCTEIARSLGLTTECTCGEYIIKAKAGYMMPEYMAHDSDPHVCKINTGDTTNGYKFIKKAIELIDDNNFALVPCECDKCASHKRYIDNMKLEFPTKMQMALVREFISPAQSKDHICDVHSERYGDMIKWVKRLANQIIDTPPLSKGESIANDTMTYIKFYGNFEDLRVIELDRLTTRARVMVIKQVDGNLQYSYETRYLNELQADYHLQLGYVAMPVGDIVKNLQLEN